jgi:outer membrane protein assembly factor BamB
MDGDRVSIAAQGSDLTGQQQFGIRSYIAKSGALLWQAPGFWGDIALDGPRLIATGTFADGAGLTQPLAQAFHAKTGAVLWTTKSPLPAGFRSVGPGVVAIKGGKAFVASTARLDINGSLINEPCLVRGYDLKTGARLWQTLQETSTFCFPAQVASDGNHVVVSGVGGGSGDGFTVLAFDAQTGLLVWLDDISMSSEGR